MVMCIYRPKYCSSPKFTSEGKFLTKWGTHGTGEGQFTHPHGVAVDS
jgi:hypothetical protein